MVDKNGRTEGSKTYAKRKLSRNFLAGRLRGPSKAIDGGKGSSNQRGSEVTQSKGENDLEQEAAIASSKPREKAAAG